MANLVIDICNSFVKTAIFDFNELLWNASYTHVDDELLNRIVAEYKPQKAIVSTVKRDHTESWEPGLSKQIPLGRSFLRFVYTHTHSFS